MLIFGVVVEDAALGADHEVVVRVNAVVTGRKGQRAARDASHPALACSASSALSTVSVPPVTVSAPCPP